MTLKIQRSQNEGSVVFALSGRMKLEDAFEVKKLIGLETVNDPLVLDLKEVALVHRDVVGFLARWEMQGIRLEHCPSFVREWILQVRAKPKLDDP